MYISVSQSIAATTSILSPTLTRATILSAYATIPAVDSGGGHGGGDGGGGSQLQRWSSLIGIVTAIIGNILISFALNIQRYAHIRIEQEWERRKEKSGCSSRTQLPKNYGTIPITKNGATNDTRHGHTEDERENVSGEEDALTRSFESTDSQITACHDDDHIEKEPYLNSGYWWAGIVLMTIGETGNFLAYGFAPASIVSPLGVVALISNCVIAPIMLKERFRWRDFWGVVVAVAGAVTVVLSAKHQEKKLGPHEVIDAITSMEFGIYMAVTFTFIGILMWASPRYGHNSILIDLGLVGLYGGYTALSTKGVASMLSSTLWKAFTSPITFALIAVLVGTAIMQVKYVNKALQRFDSTQVIPVQFVMFTLSVIIGSAVLYGDFESTSTDRALKFIGGCLLTFFGVFLITSGRSRGDDQYDDDGDDERIGLSEDLPSGEERPYHGGIDKHRRTSGSVTDGALDYPDTSRRSSRVSFLVQQPDIPRANSTISKPPSISLTHSGPPTSRNSLESEPLISNPWKESRDSLLSAPRHPGIPSPSTVVSSSLLPSEAMLSQNALHQSIRRSNSHSTPRTYPSQQHANGPPTADTPRPVTPAYSLRSSMMPGPFISPLSSSLSAVVADTLRRGVESPLRNRRKFRRPTILRRRSTRQQENGDEEENEGLALSKTVSAGASHDREEQKRSRARSLSNALGLGDFWRSNSKRQKRDEEEDEAGPSSRV